MPANSSGGFSSRIQRIQVFMPAISCTSKSAITQTTSTRRLAMPVDITPMIARQSNGFWQQKQLPELWRQSVMSGLQNNYEPHCRRSTNAHLRITLFYLPPTATRRITMKTQDVTTMIRTYLKTLKLNRMASALDEELSRAVKDASPPSELLERLLALEVGDLTERRIERRIRESKLPERKLLADFDFVFQKGVDKRQIMELATLDFAIRRQGVIIAGTSGAGKSHIAKALLLIGCQKTFRCRYVTATTMLRELLASLADNTLEQKLKRFLSPEILLIDEVGFDRLEQHDARNANLFHKVIDGRYCKGSTILTTNIDFRELGDYLGDPVITAATVDRMIHHSIIINIDGPSWRLHESKQLNTRE
ncbi:hypothetical protein D4S03_08380 [bacterium]|nr:MAG: hypothetical protein D4S03_08380 [bacterium]